jgi:hypothetical protein
MLSTDQTSVARELSPDEVAAYLTSRHGMRRPLTRYRVYELARQGILPCLRLGRRVIFTTTLLDQFIEQGGRGLAVLGTPEVDLAGTSPRTRVRR